MSLLTYQQMVEIRWPDGVFCPKCGSWPPKVLVRRDGWAGWRCPSKDCRFQFTLTAGTWLNRTYLSIDDLAMIADILGAAPQNYSTLAELVGITQPTAMRVVTLLQKLCGLPERTTARSPVFAGATHVMQVLLAESGVL